MKCRMRVMVEVMCDVVVEADCSVDAHRKMYEHPNPEELVANSKIVKAEVTAVTYMSVVGRRKNGR